MKRTHRLTCGGLLRRALALTLCAALAAGAFSGCQKRESKVPTLDTSLIILAPSDETEGIIPLDTAFTVSFSEKVRLSEGEALALFRFVPETAFTVEKQKDTFILQPESPLPQNTVINLQAVDAKGTVLRSWAYQTQAALRVARSIPYDGSDYVPTDSGIEITFAGSPLSAEGFASHFTLTAEGETAAVPGSVLQSGQTMVFVPTEPLQAGTAYQAVVDGALTSADGMALGDSYLFAFRTADVQDGKGAGDYLMNASPIAETFVTGDAPVIAVNCGREFSGQSVSVSIYRFPSPDSYRAELEALAQERDGSRFPDYVRPEVDTAALESLGTFEAQITSPGGDDYWGTRYIMLPGDFGAGWYYVQVKMISPVSGSELSLEKFLQLSDLSLFHMQANGEGLFWVNHAGTGAPVSGAKLDIAGAVSFSGTTGEDGTLRIDATADESGGEGVLDIVSGGERFIDLYSAQGRRPMHAREQYAAYLYTDRPLYMATDTIRAWGVVRPRAGVSAPPQNLRLVLGSYDEELYSIPVTLGEDGTFTAELPFERLGSSELTYTSLVLCCGEGKGFSDENRLSQVSVTIGDYVKPVYLPGIALDRPVYQAGDMVEATFTASFFDNTPAIGFMANLDLYGASETVNFTVTTGGDGSATQVFPLPEGVPAGEAGSWRPQYLSLYASNAMGENLNFNLNQFVPVFWRDMAIRTELSGEGDARTLTVFTNAIDLSNIRQESDLYDQENYIGAPVDSSLSVEVHKTYFEKTPTGSYYDFIHKRNVTQYSYDHRDDVVDTYTVKTQGGRCEITSLPEAGPEVGYYLLLTAPDSQGRLVSQRATVGWMSSYYYETGLHRYTFIRADVADPQDYEVARSFDENTTMRFGLQDNGIDVDGGRLLWATAQTGVKGYAVENSPSLSLPFDESMLPNFALVGAYFDGRYIYPVSQEYYAFSPKNRELNIQVTADKEKYAPGDTAQIAVVVTEKQGGAPAANAAVSLSLVDESVFAIQDREAAPLSSLYEGAYYPDIVTYVSYRQYSVLGDGGAEKGGGGGEEAIRSDFKDTAAFLSLTTDSAGRATAEVTLPDNITSWRATVQAVTETLHAGDSREAVIATLPFFINEVLSSQFLEGDDAMLTLRCAGGAVSAGTMVDYTVTLQGPDGERTASAAGNASDFTVLPLGKLQRGSYTVTLQAQSGEYSDGVQKTVQVSESGVQTQLSKSFALEEGIAIDPQRFPVRIGFYNADYAVWAQVLDHLWTAWGGRTDERMARRYAEEKLCELSGEQLPQQPDTFSDVLHSYGDVSLLPYDSGSVPFSARVHLAAPDYVLAMKSPACFRNALGYGQEETENLAYAYLGLAAHREPILGTLRELLRDPAGFTEKDQLVLLAALAALGDMETASGYYEKRILPYLQQGQSEDGEPLCFYQRSQDVEENLEWTAAASLTASLLRAPEADGMMMYLIKNRSTKELYYLEEMVYLRYNEPKGEEQAKLSYKKDGKTHTLDLEKTGMQFVSFVAEDFEKADIQQKSGTVYARAYYTGGLQEALSQENRAITLEKTVTPKEGTELQIGDIARIVIRPQMDSRINPFGMTIDDYIPSGLRFLSVGGSESDGKWAEGWHLIRQEGQKVSFGYYAYSYDTGETPMPGEETYEAPSELVYYARCAVAGTYVVDSAYASVSLSSAWGASERSSVTVDE